MRAASHEERPLPFLRLPDITLLQLQYIVKLLNDFSMS
jgi:hypothetical protein